MCSLGQKVDELQQALQLTSPPLQHIKDYILKGSEDNQPPQWSSLIFTLGKVCLHLDFLEERIEHFHDRIEELEEETTGGEMTLHVS